MKKFLLFLVVLLTSGIVFSQINITTSWPDASWTIAGTYAAGNLLDNPTLVTGGSSDFKFDDTQVSNTGDVIYLESPVVNLSNAASGETGLIIHFNIAYTLSASAELLEMQYWDADANSWGEFSGGSQADPGTVGDYTNCTYDPVNSGVDQVLDFSTFTDNQKQNFKVRFVYKDGNLSSGTGGLCMSPPTFISISCQAPTNLYLASIGTNGAQIGWMNNNSEGDWQIDYGLAGFNHKGGTVMNTDQNPTGISSLTQNTGYDVYVRADCSGGDASLLSPWSNNFNFTTLGACAKPTNATTQYITASGANISFTPGSDESSWNAEFGLQGYEQGSSGIIITQNFNTNTSNGVPGFNTSTTYDYYLQANCSGGGTSNWAGPFTFKTGWLNLQWPSSGSINVGDSFNVYTQLWIDGVTNNSANPSSGIKVYIGCHNANTNPNTWPQTDWTQATFNKNVGENDEYIADIGNVITSSGTYYYASRYIFYDAQSTPSMPWGNDGRIEYGGYNGGLWDGTNNVSGVLTVNSTLGVEDQAIAGFNFYPNPVKDKITLTANQNINQIEIYNLLGQNVLMKQPKVSHYNMYLNTLKTGVYFMKVQVGSKVGNYKIVKQ